MVLIFKDNKYWINNRYQNTINWTCKDRKRLGCTSCIQTTVEGRYIKHKVLLVKSRTGKDLLMLDGYTFYQHKNLKDGHRWSCTRMGSRSCRAFLHVTHEKMVVRAYTVHSHSPSNYFLEKISEKFAKKAPNKKQTSKDEESMPMKIANVQGSVGF